MRWFKLDDAGEAVECSMLDHFLWCMTNPDLQLAFSEFGDGTYVSTVFLSVTISFGEGRYDVFETMVFTPNESLAKQLDYTQQRYPNRVEALKGHQELCNQVISALRMN